MKLSKVVARNIAAIRNRNEMSKGELGKKAKIHASQGSRLESGQSNITFELIDRVDKALGVLQRIFF